MATKTRKPTKKRPADVWRLVIPDYFPPSLNRTRVHWSKVRKNKERAMDLLTIYAAKAGGAPRFKGRARVTITRLWGKGQRAWDTDNLYGAVKPLVDAMRVRKAGRNQAGLVWHGGLGIIEDDDDNLGLTVFQEKNDGTHGVPAESEATLIVVEGEREA